MSQRTLILALSGLALVGYLGYVDKYLRNTESAASTEVFRQPFTPVEVPDELADLPNLKGQGYVRDLRQAAVLDARLRALMQQYVAEPQMRDRSRLLEPILFAWISTSGRSASIEEVLEQADGRLPLTITVSDADDEKAARLLSKLHALEVVTGNAFFSFNGFSEATDVATLKLQSGAVSRSLNLKEQDGRYALPAGALSLRPKQTEYTEKAYVALIGSLREAMVQGRFRHCAMQQPRDGDKREYQDCRQERTAALNLPPPTTGNPALEN